LFRSKTFWAVIISVLIIGGICVGFLKDESDLADWIPLIAAVLSSVGTIISQIESIQDRLKIEEESNLPYLVFEKTKEWYPEELEENYLRFPWGGDPPPEKVYPYFLPEDVSDDDYDSEVEADCRVVYIQSKIINEGMGAAKNVKMYLASNQDDYQTLPFISVRRDNDYEFYFRYLIKSDIDESEYIFYIEFNTASNKTYIEKVKCSIRTYDEVLNGVDFYSEWPHELVLKKENLDFDKVDLD